MSAGDATFGADAFFVSYSRLAAARSTTIESRSTTPTVGRPSIAKVPNLYGSPPCAAVRSPAAKSTPAITIPAENQPGNLTSISPSLFG